MAVAVRRRCDFTFNECLTSRRSSPYLVSLDMDNRSTQIRIRPRSRLCTITVALPPALPRRSAVRCAVSMPQQRIDSVPTSQKITPSISEGTSNLTNSQLRDPRESCTSPCESPSPSPVCTGPYPKPRTSWVFSHMPDEDREARYYNQRTGKEEWRCKHCSKTYSCSGGTAAPAKHLTDPPPEGHGLPEGAPRTCKVKNIRSILEQARLAAEENPRKRRRLNDQSGDSIALINSKHCM